MKKPDNMFRLILSLAIVLIAVETFAQQKVRKIIHIENADVLLYDNSVITNVQRLIGNVKLSHNNIVLYCDSAWSYARTNSVDCFGNVHIISNDTLHMYSEKINYSGDDSLPSRGKVTLKTPTHPSTDSLDFDTKHDIGYYENWGKIVDSTNTLTSRIGTYYFKE
jgi:hypothetical protein